MCTQSSGSYGTTSNSIFVKGTRYNNVAIDTLMGKLNRMARENFIKIVEPEKNIVELVERITRIVPRRKSFDVMPNVDVETIRVSITMAMAAKRKRVIALVGDPGLGRDPGFLARLVELFVVRSVDVRRHQLDGDSVEGHRG